MATGARAGTPGAGNPRVALVGTPCGIQGATALDRYGFAGEGDPIALTIALMCTRSFEHARLSDTLVDLGVDPENVAKLDVSSGVLYAFDAAEDTLLAEPVDSFDAAALKGCAECADFVGGAADISAGSVGSAEGYTSVIVRTERGERAWDRAADALDVAPFDGQDALDRIASWNRRRAEALTPRDLDPAGPIGIGYEEHRDEYDETDRAPRAFNPARVRQYEEWC